MTRIWIFKGQHHSEHAHKEVCLPRENCVAAYLASDVDRLVEAARALHEAVQNWRHCNPDDNEEWHGRLASISNADDYFAAALGEEGK